jgi:hypothetical protein
MATPTNNKNSKQAATPAPAETKKSVVKSVAQKKEYTLLFDKVNYMYMIGGIALIFIGFLLMSGGKSANPHEFHYDEIYSFRRITLAPIVILLGFGVEVYAIMKKPKQAASTVSVQQ